MHDLIVLFRDIRATRLFDCPDCPFQSTRSSNLKHHRVSVHGLVIRRECNVCGQKFKYA